MDRQNCKASYKIQGSLTESLDGRYMSLSSKEYGQ